MMAASPKILPPCRKPLILQLGSVQAGVTSLLLWETLDLPEPSTISYSVPLPLNSSFVNAVRYWTAHHWLYWTGYDPTKADSTPTDAELRIDLFFPATNTRRTIWKVEDADKVIPTTDPEIEASKPIVFGIPRCYASQRSVAI